MKKYAMQSVFIFAFAVCLPSTGLAVNPGAHIYVAQEVFASGDIDLLYGSIAPDLSLYVPNPEKWESGFEDTHYNYIILKPQGWTEPWKRFAMGWMTHNEEWGADLYSHIEYPNGITGNGYVIDKASVLVGYMISPGVPEEIKMLIAHNAIEFAIDILIQDELDEYLGLNLFNVAMNRSTEDVRRLFNILVAKGKVTDRETLYQSEMIFRNLTLYYSSALEGSNSSYLEPLAVFGSEMALTLYDVEIDEGSVESLLQIAISLCSSDFYQFLNDTIDGIKAYLEID